MGGSTGILECAGPFVCLPFLGGQVAGPKLGTLTPGTGRVKRRRAVVRALEDWECPRGREDTRGFENSARRALVGDRLGWLPAFMARALEAGAETAPRAFA